MSVLPTYPLSAIQLNNNISTPHNKSSRELDNFPSGNVIGLCNEIMILRTNIEVGTQFVSQSSSSLIEDDQAFSIIQRFYDTSSPSFSLSSVSLNQMSGLTYIERTLVSEYLLTHT
jgi:hypothetical protein